MKPVLLVAAERHLQLFAVSLCRRAQIEQPRRAGE